MQKDTSQGPPEAGADETKKTALNGKVQKPRKRETKAKDKTDVKTKKASRGSKSSKDSPVEKVAN